MRRASVQPKGANSGIALSVMRELASTWGHPMSRAVITEFSRRVKGHGLVIYAHLAST
jgi:hypothetical protein